MMDTPIKQIVNRREAQAGMGCMMCHSIVQVKSTMGQGDFMLEYPELHELAATKNPVIRWLHDFSIKLNPEPHRRVFLKPFMKMQTPEFCSSCHKVHLDLPVNNYRWLRGFNEYDNWQASGVSGLGARSFYYPPKPQGCAGLPHAADDQVERHGQRRRHDSFALVPGANTALPIANQDQHQMEMEQNFLKSGALTIDIFALSTAARRSAAAGRAADGIADNFAVGEEAEMKTTGRERRSRRPVTAPLDEVQCHGATRRECARRCCRAHPQGRTLLSRRYRGCLDTWVELKAVDDKGQTLFWSGKVGDDGKGRSSRERISIVAADRRARQRDQQTQRVGNARGGVRAADPSGRRRHHSLPAECSAERGQQNHV